MKKETKELLYFGFWALLVTGVGLYLIYVCITPVVITEDKTSRIRCPVIAARNITEDGRTNVRREVQVRCEYGSIGLMRPTHLKQSSIFVCNNGCDDVEYQDREKGTNRKFNDDATLDPAINKGDRFICTAGWNESVKMPLVPDFKLVRHLHLENCRLDSRK